MGTEPIRKIEEPRSFRPLLGADLKELKSRLHDACFSLDERGNFSLELRGKESAVLVVVTPEISGDQYGVCIQARPIKARGEAFMLQGLALEVYKISAEEQVAEEGVAVDSQYKIRCGPLQKGVSYIIQILEPPPVLRAKPAPQAAPGGSQDEPDEGIGLADSSLEGVKVDERQLAGAGIRKQ